MICYDQRLFKNMLNIFDPDYFQNSTRHGCLKGSYICLWPNVDHFSLVNLKLKARGISRTLVIIYPAGYHMFKVNNRNTKTKRRGGFFIVNFEQI